MNFIAKGHQKRIIVKYKWGDKMQKNTFNIGCMFLRCVLCALFALTDISAHARDEPLHYCPCDCSEDRSYKEYDYSTHGYCAQTSCSCPAAGTGGNNYSFCSACPAGTTSYFIPAFSDGKLLGYLGRPDVNSYLYCEFEYVVCTLCPAGYYCPGERERIGELHFWYPKILCPAGHYCPQGASEPTKCDSNKFCPLGSVEPQSCPDIAGIECVDGVMRCMSGDESCNICPPGYYNTGDSENVSCSVCNNLDVNVSDKFERTVGNVYYKNGGYCRDGKRYLCKDEQTVADQQDATEYVYALGQTTQDASGCYIVYISGNTYKDKYGVFESSLNSTVFSFNDCE